MYYEHFGLREPPFRITPDTRLFFPGGSRGAILDAIVYAIGFDAMTGALDKIDITGRGGVKLKE